MGGRHGVRERGGGRTEERRNAWMNGMLKRGSEETKGIMDVRGGRADGCGEGGVEERVLMGGGGQGGRWINR